MEKMKRMNIATLRKIQVPRDRIITSLFGQICQRTFYQP
jgi:hypothetical protein